MIPRQLTQSTMVKLTCEVIGRGMQFGLAYAAQRILGQTSYGQFSYAFSVGYVLAVFTDFGLQLIITREVARGAWQIARTGLSIKLGLSMLALLALTGLASTRPTDQRATFLILGIALMLNTVTEYCGYVLRGLQRVPQEALLLLSMRGLTALLGIAALWGNFGMTGLAYAYATAAACAASYGVWGIRHTLAAINSPTLDRTAQSGQSFRWLLSQSLPLGVAIVLSVAYTRTGPLLLVWLHGATELGAYSVAQKLAEPMSLIPASLMAALFPSLSWAHAHNPAGVVLLQRRSLLILASVGVSLAVGIGLGSETLMTFLYRGQFRDAIWPLQILGVAILPTFVNHALTHFTVAMGQQRLNLLFNSIIFGSNLALCLWFIPRYGASGAAMSMLICECLLLGLCSIALRYSQRPLKN